MPGWNSNQSVNDVVSLLRCAGSDIAPQALTQQQGKLTLAANCETPVVTLNGPAQIRVLEFQVSPRGNGGFGNARLLIYWDGEAIPASMPPQVPGWRWRWYLFSSKPSTGAGMDGGHDGGQNGSNGYSSVLANALFLTRSYRDTGRCSPLRHSLERVATSHFPIRRSGGEHSMPLIPA